MEGLKKVWRNAKQMPAMMEAVARLAESLGALSVQFNAVRPMGRAGEMLAAGELLTVGELVRLGAWVENDLSRRTKLPVSFTLPLAFRPLARMFGRGGTGCCTCGILNVLGVLSDGSYSLCSRGEMVPDLIIGHAGKDRLERLWSESPFWRRYAAVFPIDSGGYAENAW